MTVTVRQIHRPLRPTEPRGLNPVGDLERGGQDVSMTMRRVAVLESLFQREREGPAA